MPLMRYVVVSLVVYCLQILFEIVDSCALHAPKIIFLGSYMSSSDIKFYLLVDHTP